jgi:hypothetical protein
MHIIFIFNILWNITYQHNFIEIYSRIFSFGKVRKSYVKLMYITFYDNLSSLVFIITFKFLLFCRKYISITSFLGSYKAIHTYCVCHFLKKNNLSSQFVVIIFWLLFFGKIILITFYF